MDDATFAVWNYRVPHVHIPDLPWQEQRSPTGKFRSRCRNISLALGGIRNTGVWGGGHPFDVQIRRVPVGAAVCPHHAHVAQWEFFLVQAGTGTIRVGSERHPVKGGDCFIHPPGEAHQLINTGAEELEMLIIADNPPLDAFYYPDSGKWGLRPPGHFFRLQEVDYFDGEDEPAAPVAGGTVPTPPATPFVQRFRPIDALRWEPWSSPKGRFRSHSKELSVALGAARNTATGLGGHPFDVELARLEPGACACPYHQHAAQWEMYLMVSGTAVMRAADSVHPFPAGSVALHPPHQPHQIRNESKSEDAVFLLITDNPPVDYWHYPDSNKWGVAAPRMFFRTTAVDYYDGEE